MGQRKDLNFFGGSQLIGARGQSLKVASYDDEDLAFARLILTYKQKSRLEIPYLRDRRTDIYSIEYLSEK